jgi:predicted DCC family thiol-disulfide oxidoreductase YuxK
MGIPDTSSRHYDTVYYDGDCPLCTAEVCKLSRYSMGKIELQNIHEIENTAGLPSKDVLLARLHVKTGNGDWLVGIDANIRAWHHTRFAGLWRVLGWPVVRSFSAAAYECWLKWRQYRNSRSLGSS